MQAVHTHFLLPSLARLHLLLNWHGLGNKAYSQTLEGNCTSCYMELRQRGVNSTCLARSPGSCPVSPLSQDCEDHQLGLLTMGRTDTFQCHPQEYFQV